MFNFSCLVIGLWTVRHTLRRFLIVLLASQLLLGQQLALAHMIGHAGEHGREHAEVLDTTAHDEDEGHGAADALLHVCSTCVAFLGLDLLLVGTQVAAQAAIVWDKLVDSIAPPVPAFHHPAFYRSRAPPSLQS
jgi:hypothetical protein